MRAASITLAAISFAYAGISSYTDLKSRELYVFPAWMLAIAWTTLSLVTGMFTPDLGGIADEGKDALYYINSPLIALMIYAGVNILLMLALNHFRIWGGGDTDFMMLYAMYLYGMWGADAGIFNAFILEIAGLTVSVIAAAVIAAIECGIRKREIGLHYGAAVIPGFLIGMAIPLIILPVA